MKHKKNRTDFWEIKDQKKANLVALLTSIDLVLHLQLQYTFIHCIYVHSNNLRDLSYRRTRPHQLDAEVEKTPFLPVTYISQLA